MKQIFIALFIVVTFCCISPKNEKEGSNEPKFKYLESILINTKNDQIEKMEESILNFNEIIDSLHKTNENRELIYILNSDCSYCIGKFFEFASLLRKTEEILSLSVIISVGSKETVKYYVNMSDFSKRFQIRYFENMDNKYINGSLEDVNGKIFYIYNGNIIQVFSVEECL